MLPCNREAALLALLFIFSTTVLQCESQCTVTEPTITGSNLDNICLVASQGSLSYTCTHAGEALFWTTTSSVFSSTINVRADVALFIQSEADGVVLTGANNDDANCVNSTLTYTGNLTNLQSALNGFALLCGAPGFNTANVTMLVPDLPGSPTLINVSLIFNGSVTLEWTPPTGGEGASIERYLVSVSGAGYVCPPDQCNVTTPNTTITGLQCNTSYTVTVTAVNCAGESLPSAPVYLSHLIPNGPDTNSTIVPSTILPSITITGTESMLPAASSISTCSSIDCVLRSSIKESGSRSTAPMNTNRIEDPETTAVILTVSIGAVILIIVIIVNIIIILSICVYFQWKIRKRNEPSQLTTSNPSYTSSENNYSLQNNYAYGHMLVPIEVQQNVSYVPARSSNNDESIAGNTYTYVNGPAGTPT